MKLEKQLLALPAYILLLMNVLIKDRYMMHMKLLQTLFAFVGKEGSFLFKAATRSKFELRKLCTLDFVSRDPKRLEGALFVYYLA